VVIAIAPLAGIAYALVAISAQTQLQEELPEDVRGRVYGVLFTLVSVASFVPVIAVGWITDAVGTTPVMLGVAVLIGLIGVASIVNRRRAGAPPGGKAARAHDRRRDDPAGRHTAPLESPILTPDSAAAGPHSPHQTKPAKRTRR
jgi:MFS family permease